MTLFTFRNGRLAVLAALAFAGSCRAQVLINPTTAPEGALWVAGQAWAGHATVPVKNPDGVISYFYTNSWIDVPFTVEAPGLYSLVIPVTSPIANLKGQIQVRREGSAVSWASEDFAVPNTGGWANFQDITVENIPIFQAGAQVLRVANTRLQHHSFSNREPAFENESTDTGPSTGASRETGWNFGTMTLTRTGDLPATATISGKVTSPDLGLPVASAWVMAYTGESVPEPGPLWQKGFWTRTNASGDYTLTVLAGAHNVKAGQPSMYEFEPTGQAGVTVADGQTATADLPLASRWTKTPEGRNTVQVEVEYFTGKNPDQFSTSPGAYHPSPVVVQGRPFAQNGMNAGYIDIGNYIDVPVDVPAGQAGEYTVTDLFYNGWWDGFNYFDAITKITANPGASGENSIQAVEPNTTAKDEFGAYIGSPAGGYNTPGSVTYATPLVLKQGHNIVRIEAIGTGGENAASAWDALVLTQVNVPVPTGSAAKALKVAAGLEAVSQAELSALDVVVNGQVDISDAVALARQGKL